MNICLLTHSFPPVIGGGETHVYLLARAFHRHGHHVTVVTGEAQWAPDAIVPHEPFTVLRLPHLRPFEDGRASLREILPELRSALSTKPFDVIHIHNFMPALAFAPLAELIRACVILTVHSTPLPETGKVIGHFGDYDLERAFAQFILRQHYYRKVVCPSRFYQRWAVRLGVPKRKTVVIPHGIDIQRFRKHRDEQWRGTHGYDPDDFLVLCAARMIPRKGILDLVDAIDVLDNPRVKLYIASSVATGSTDYAGQVTSLIRRRRLSARIRLALDRHTVTDMPQLMANCDALVLPSHREGFGLVLLEAMAAGLPVIGTRTSGMAEVITHGENGLLAEPHNSDDLASKLQAIITNRALANRLVSGGRKAVAKKFSLERQVADLLRCYRR